MKRKTRQRGPGWRKAAGGFFLACWAGLGMGVAMAAAKPERPPNIVFILADDLGFGEIGAEGQTAFPTPHLDGLAAAGQRWTQHYSGSAVCAPARCALMTGRHMGHAAVRDNGLPNPAGGPQIRVPLPDGEATVAEWLRLAGYATACVGKWGLGEEGTEGVPWRQGFDLFYGFLNQDHAWDHFPDFIYRNAEKEVLVPNFEDKKLVHIQDRFEEECLRFLEANRDRPFFLYAAWTLPHAEITASREELADLDRVAPAASGWTEAERCYAAMVRRVDRSVGAVLDKIEALGLAEDTVVFFASDNGPARVPGKNPATFHSAPGLRGQKGDLYEGGIRVPFLARWPGRIAPGTLTEAPAAFWDFLPTACELAGLPTPPGIDGVSYLPVLRGEKPPRAGVLYWEYLNRGVTFQALREGPWKLLYRSDGPLELYHLGDDPGETRNRAAEEPERVRPMAARLAAQHRAHPLYLWEVAPR